MGTTFSSSRDVDEDGELDERCCVLFFGNYNPYKYVQGPEDSFSFEVKRTMDEQDGGRKVPTVASGDMFQTRTEAGGTADPRIAAIAKMETKTESESTTQVTVAAEPTAATTSAPSDTAGVPWVLASHPVFKQYGKLAVRLGATDDGLQPSGHFLSLNDDSQPLKFETPLFYGRVVVRVKDAAGAPPTKYFDPPVKRKMSVHIEGRFKKRICTNNVVVVTDFERKFVKLPPLAKLAVSQLQKMCESSKLDIFGDTPSLRAPFVTLMDRIEARYVGKPAGVPVTVQVHATDDNPALKRLRHVEKKIEAARESGDDAKVTRLQKQCNAIQKYLDKMEKPSDKADDDMDMSERGMGPWVWGDTRRLSENSALLGGGVGRNPSDSTQRVSFFDKEENRVAAFFEPDMVYSFDFVEESMCLNEFRLAQSVFKLNFGKCLDGQPLNVDVRVLDDAGDVCGSLIRLEFLHEDVCPTLLSGLRASSASL